MKLLLIIPALFIGSLTIFGQCSVAVNDSLYANNNYVLNAIDQVGQAPFQYSWTVTDGNGEPVQYIQNITGDSITIPAAVISSAYGCVIYQLCMTDALNCTTCVSDTGTVQVPFGCFSAFSSEMVGPNQIAIFVENDIPPFLVVAQFMQWTDGNGDPQGMPYMGPGTILQYTAGPQNTQNTFTLCVMTILTTGGCINCEEIPYSMLGISEKQVGFSIVPNPAQNAFQLQSELPVLSFSLTDLNGRHIMEQGVANAIQQEINVSDLPNGTYFVNITRMDGNFVEKLIIRR